MFWYAIIAFIILFRSQSVRITDSFVVLDINATIVSNVYSYSFSITGLQTSSYTIGHYTIGNCTYNSYLPNSLDPYMLEYTDIDLINNCGFNYSNNQITGSQMVGIVELSADICGSYDEQTELCNIVGISSNLMNVEVTFMLNLMSNATIFNIDISVKNINSSTIIDVIYPSILSYKGINYSYPVTSFTIAGITTACFRQTIFGVGNSLEIVPIDTNSCDDSFNIFVTCQSNSTTIILDLSKIPCTFSNLNEVSTNYEIDGTYIVEYCMNFDMNTFSSLPIVNELHTCTGSYTSNVKLSPIYNRQRTLKTYTEKSSHISTTTSNISISFSSEDSNNSSNNYSYIIPVTVTVIMVGFIIISIIFCKMIELIVINRHSQPTYTRLPTQPAQIEMHQPPVVVDNSDNA